MECRGNKEDKGDSETTEPDEEQKEPNSVRETKALDICGDGSELLETPMQDPEKLFVRDFRITGEIL